jgi:hypothetical protein
MALIAQCKNCQTVALITDPSDPHASLACPPGSDCCQEDHHHGDAANSCAGGHGACPAPAACPVWGDQEGDCPGGHCGLGVDGCTVCRPITILALRGTTQIKVDGGA